MFFFCVSDMRFQLSLTIIDYCKETHCIRPTYRNSRDSWKPLQPAAMHSGIHFEQNLQVAVTHSILSPCWLDNASFSNGSSFGPSRFYRSAWQQPYPIKNRRFFIRTITLRPQILIRKFSIWYVKYAARHGASFGRLRFLISLNLSKR